MKKAIKVISLLMMAILMISALSACSSDSGKAKVIDIELTQEDYAFGVDKSQPELLTAVNAFIKEIMDNGKFDEICNKYFGDGTPTKVYSAKEDSTKDQLLVATNAAFAPFEYTEGDAYLGIDMEIAALLAEKLGKELVIVNMNFDAVCLSVGQKKCDIAMAGLTISEDRKEHVTFSDPYYKAAQKLVVKENDTTFDACKTVEDVEAILAKLDSTTIVGAQNGTTGQKYIEGDADWGFDGLKAAYKGYDNGSLAIQDMLNNNVNFVIIDAAPADTIVASINKMS